MLDWCSHPYPGKQPWPSPRPTPVSARVRRSPPSLPAELGLLARLRVEGLDNVPPSGPVILAANHRDNLDGYLLMHLIPRMVHVAARPSAFGTGCLCAVWRR